MKTDIGKTYMAFAKVSQICKKGPMDRIRFYDYVYERSQKVT